MSYPPTRLSVAVQSPGGRPQRWAEDEYRAENVPGELTFSTTIPGGDERYSCSLARRAGDSSPDLEPLSMIKVLGAEGGVRGVFELESAPVSSGDELSISPQGVGYQAELERRSDCSIVFVDRDLQAWVGASAARREALYTVGVDVIEDPTVDPDASGLPQLVLHNDGQCAAAMISEAWFDAGPGAAVASVYFDYVGRALGAGWSGHANSAADDTNVAAAGTDVVAGATTPTGTRTETFATPRRYAMFDLGIVAAQTVERNRRLRLRRVSAWGPEAVKRGTAPDDGVFVSDALGTIISKFVPGLRASTSGPLPSIQASGNVVPHLSFREPTTPLEMIEAANRSQQWDWEVKWGQGGPTFYYHPPGAIGKRWRARIGPSNLQETGQDVSRVVNGVVVTYQDVDGTTLRVGPPGSQANTTSPDLADTDPSNPANKAGLPFYAPYEIGVSTAARATEIGARVLALYKERDRSGTASLVGWVEDSGGRPHPSSVVRAGDEIAFVNASDTSYRRIVRTSYDHATVTNSIDLDAPPISLDALLERSNESFVSLGLAA